MAKKKQSGSDDTDVVSEEWLEDSAPTKPKGKSEDGSSLGVEGGHLGSEGAALGN